MISNFQLFPDRDLYQCIKRFQELEHQALSGVKKNDDESLVIVLRQSGGFHDKESFLNQLLTNASEE